MADGQNIHDLPGLKQDELERMGPCIVCRKPMLQQPAHPMFFCVTVEQAIWDQGAVMRQAGLTVMFQGHAGLARIMGPNADLAKVINRPRRVAVHFDCAGKIGHLLALLPEEPGQDGQTAAAPAESNTAP